MMHESLGLTDTQGRPLLAVVVQRSWRIRGGRLEPLPLPICVEGSWWGEPGASSPRLEPATAPHKPHTDCVLLGHAHAAEVDFRLGPVRQQARIQGARTWQKRWFGGWRPSPPAPFQPVPLTWEHASYAGQRNPLGRGCVPDGQVPEIEHPDLPVRWGRPAAPVGFGFLGHGWEPRGARANAAPPELICPGHLRGDEPVRVVGCRHDLAFRLPAADPPRVRIGDQAPPLHLDTVIVDADAATVSVQWRTRRTCPWETIVEVSSWA